MKIYKILISALLIVGSTSSILAQENAFATNEGSSKKSWEIGLGGSVFQFNRVSFSNFSKLDKGYRFDLNLKHALFGGNLYLARELNSYFYIDVQGTIGFTKESLGNKDKNKWMYMVGPGLQWRLGEYFGSKYIDPYLRAGINYMHKDFDIIYEGTEGLSPSDMQWVMDNIHNKDGVDRKDLMPISLGGGVNMWLNDRIGIGMQADYILMPYKQVANSLQGTVRVMWRIGGTSKKPIQKVEYVEVEKIIEKIVEKPVVVEKVVEVQTTPEYKALCSSFEDISFEFDKADLTADSKKVVANIASALKQDQSKHYLITGYTDSKGSPVYNENLSKRRAAAIVDELVNLGVPKSMLKSRGVGSKISYAKPATSNEIRRGDRKVTLELISNSDYWNYLPSNDL